MLVDLENAAVIVRNTYPKGKVQGIIDYDNLWVFQIFGDDPDEGSWDPFFSIDKKTGEFKEFSVMTDASPFLINYLFKTANLLK